MNALQKSMSGVQATEDLKQNTLRYLEEQQAGKSRIRPHYTFRYALAAICLFLFLGTGGYSVYRKPVSYISIDVNPSIELGINRFGKVVSAKAYNEDGQSILQHVSLKNISYTQAISRLLADESDLQFLREDSLLVFTVISDQSHLIMEEISANEFAQTYRTLLYTSDTTCMEEAHSHEMSFGIYRAYLELSQYDQSITVEDCHGMSMGEIQNRIEGCRSHNGNQHHNEAPSTGGNHHHNGNQSQSGTQVQDGSQTQDGTQIQDGSQTQNGSQTPDGAQSQNGAQTSDGSQSQDGAQTSDGSQSQNASQSQDDSPSQSDSPSQNDSPSQGNHHNTHHGGRH